MKGIFSFLFFSFVLFSFPNEIPNYNERELCGEGLGRESYWGVM
jgi:hypothetical protein